MSTHNFYLDSKSFIVDAQGEDGRNLFFAWFNKDNVTITSLEDIPENYPSTTVCVWDSIEDFVNGISWQDWIVEGIRTDKLEELVRKSLNEVEKIKETK